MEAIEENARTAVERARASADRYQDAAVRAVDAMEKHDGPTAAAQARSALPDLVARVERVADAFEQGLGAPEPERLAALTFDATAFALVLDLAIGEIDGQLLQESESHDRETAR